MEILKFTKNADGKYVSSFTSNGTATAIQLNRVKAGELNIYANIGTLPNYILLSMSAFYAGKNIMRAIDVPEGVNITLESETEVIEGAYE